ncbi:coiled-coil domain-containing protein-domain-containing protein [Aspergillus avenaceus]|uniref:Coiled-coil domain-containing protein-domain-containing protein n=1 Tax=Aspergillus avenaceus TaxID=36643 RepID=A0A5N6U1C0_ASPAV|nr:coiled-coil domain-containing protein-domain-containing protein [Aspergillus avenaceus]
MPLFLMGTGIEAHNVEGNSNTPNLMPPSPTQVKNRRKRYLDTHPEYFSADLELADPLLYDRLIRRFQTPSEREAEGRAKGFSGILQADLLRSEAKMEALSHPDPNAMFSYNRGPNGEILAEDKDEIPTSKEDGEKAWRWEMTLRFLRGEDRDFDYPTVDDNDEYDDWNEEQERYFDNEEPEWIVEGSNDGDIGSHLKGETGIQDF